MQTDTRPRRNVVVRLAASIVPLALAAVAALVYFGDGTGTSELPSGSVQVVGSETMRPVVTACAEDFMTRNPRADVIVKGGGSGDGIAALLHGMVDIAMTSRELSLRERDYAVSRGIAISVVGLALDGIAVIVNPASRVTTLDLGQLQDIFAGKLRNWHAVDGGEAEILPFARAAGSGTASLFGDKVLRDKTYAASVRQLPTNEAIVAEVAARPDAIGYTGLGAMRGAGSRVKVVALRIDPASAPASPTPETIRSGTYPLARTLNLATVENPSGTAKALLDFCMGPSGQALLQRAGYVAMKSSAH
jgi:phosphate transport system substrate-binding protein